MDRKFVATIQSITKPTICCLACHGVVKHILGLIYEEMHVLNIFLENEAKEALEKARENAAFNYFSKRKGIAGE
jgi:predicted transcriptional regulator